VFRRCEIEGKSTSLLSVLNLSWRANSSIIRCETKYEDSKCKTDDETNDSSQEL